MNQSPLLDHDHRSGDEVPDPAQLGVQGHGQDRDAEGGDGERLRPRRPDREVVDRPEEVAEHEVRDPCRAAVRAHDPSHWLPAADGEECREHRQLPLDPLVEDRGALRRVWGRAEGEKGGEGKGERGFRPAGDAARGGRACERIAEPCWRTTVPWR